MPVPAPGPETRVYQPVELNREVRLHLEAGFPRLWIAGEVSNLARPASGHWYFTLKDDRAQIRCALFRGQRGNVGGDPQNGDQVLVRGRLSLYEARGDYQLIADAMLPAGSGALQQAFDALKNKLEAEGLFDPELKRPLPAYPSTIAVVTSPTGAAVRDILTTLGRRWPAARIKLYKTQVQGDQAAPAIAHALDNVDRDASADVVILARGGGSLEDLWAFNDEALARRIRAMRMPVVSGVGHETDFTIADFAADLRAATPTAAAEAATPDGPALLRQVEALQQRLIRGSARQLQQNWQGLDSLDRRLAGQHPARSMDDAALRLNSLLKRAARACLSKLGNTKVSARNLNRRLIAHHPTRRLTDLKQREATQHKRLTQAFNTELARHSARFSQTARALNNVSPLAVLARGYALIEDQHGKLLSHADDFNAGQTIHTRVRDVRIESLIKQVDPTPPLPKPDPDGE